MPAHDWTRIDAGPFHAFHTAWTTHLSEALNAGVLPPDYYALPEQHAATYVFDILTLRIDPPKGRRPKRDAAGGTAVADAPPRVGTRLVADADRVRRRTVAVRHVSRDRVVALIEIASPGDKDRGDHVRQFVAKVRDAVRHGVHLLLIDVLPPGRHDRGGLPATAWRALGGRGVRPQAARPLSMASVVAGVPPEAYFERFAVGDALAAMPLFLSPERYIDAPLESTYTAAFRGLPAVYRKVLEA